MFDTLLMVTMTTFWRSSSGCFLTCESLRIFVASIDLSKVVVISINALKSFVVQGSLRLGPFARSFLNLLFLIINLPRLRGYDENQNRKNQHSHNDQCWDRKIHPHHRIWNWQLLCNLIFIFNPFYQVGM